jgi:SAM-dependent methyltransferase
MKRAERCSLEDTEGTNRLVVAEHLAHYRLAIPRLRGKVLDAGSGEGFGVDMMRKANLEALGIDLSAEVVEKTNDRYGPYYGVGSIVKIPFENETFDSITCMEVIEHVPETDAVIALKEMYRVLRPGGVFVLSTPNSRNSLGGEVNDYHFKEYTSEEMSALLHQTGFQDIEMQGLFCANPAVQGMAKSSLAKAWMRFKHLIGLNRPIGNLGHIMEKILTGHTSQNILNEDSWSLVPGDETTMTMMFFSTKPAA